MKCIALLSVLIVAPLLPDVSAAQAAEGRWCAISSIGQGGIREDCQYATFEACQKAAALDRGSCSQNPRWTGSDSAKKRRKN
jgi:Protein of unknown function (DUF3551)